MAAPADVDRRRRVLVACVGNPLRGDDGFGLAVASQLQGALPADADLIETGAGLGLIHQLMNGYDGLIVVDAIERRASPGTVFILVPEVREITQATLEDWRAQLADPHLAEPSRILSVARAAGVLPTRVLVVGCQPEACEEFGERLSEPVADAVPIVTRRVRELVDELLVEIS